VYIYSDRRVFSQTPVVRHPIEHPTHIQASMTLPTRPHAIFSTLQGTQNPDTKPTLQRAKSQLPALPNIKFKNQPIENY